MKNETTWQVVAIFLGVMLLISLFWEAPAAKFPPELVMPAGGKMPSDELIGKWLNVEADAQGTVQFEIEPDGNMLCWVAGVPGETRILNKPGYLLSTSDTTGTVIDNCFAGGVTILRLFASDGQLSLETERFWADSGRTKARTRVEKFRRVDEFPTCNLEIETYYDYDSNNRRISVHQQAQDLAAAWATLAEAERFCNLVAATACGPANPGSNSDCVQESSDCEDAAHKNCQIQRGGGCLCSNRRAAESKAYPALAVTEGQPTLAVRP